MAYKPLDSYILYIYFLLNIKFISLHQSIPTIVLQHQKNYDSFI